MTSEPTKKCLIKMENYQKAQIRANQMRWNTRQGANHALNLLIEIGHYALENGLISLTQWYALSTPSETTPNGAAPQRQVSMAPTPIRSAQLQLQPERQPQLVSQVDVDDEDGDDDEPFINKNYDPNSPMWRKTG